MAPWSLIPNYINDKESILISDLTSASWRCFKHYGLHAENIPDFFIIWSMIQIRVSRSRKDKFLTRLYNPFLLLRYYIIISENFRSVHRTDHRRNVRDIARRVISSLSFLSVKKYSQLRNHLVSRAQILYFRAFTPPSTKCFLEL